MGVARKICRALVGFLFTLSLISAISIMSLANFTEYENLKGIFSDIVGNQMPQMGGEVGTEEEARVLEELKAGCEGREFFEGKIGPEELKIKCSDLGQLVSTSDARVFVASSFFDGLYHKEYSCDFVGCIGGGEAPFPLVVTKVANDFYKQALNYAIVLTVVLGALLVIAAEGFNQKLKSVGFSLVWSSLPFIIVSYFTDDIVSSIAPPEVASAVAPIMDSVFSPAFMMFAYILIAGIVMVFAGYFVKRENFRFSKK